MVALTSYSHLTLKLKKESSSSVACSRMKFTFSFKTIWDIQWCSWLKHCATSRKVAHSFPDGVSGIFHYNDLSGRTMFPGLTQPLTEMSTRNISWGKGGRCVGLTTLPPSCAYCLEIWEPQPPGTLRACHWIAVTF
jgi:hypothetical protein